MMLGVLVVMLGEAKDSGIVQSTHDMLLAD